MGSGADKVSKAKSLDDRYNYDSVGVESMFNDYYKIQCMGFYSSDAHAIDLKMDFEKALCASVLEPLERCVIAFVYGLQLTFIEASKILKEKISVLKTVCNDAMDKVEAVLNGYVTTYHTTTPSKATNIDEWLQELRLGYIMPFDITDAVNTSILQFYAGKGDRLSKDTISQKVEVSPDICENGNKKYDPEEYTYYKTAESIENPFRTRAHKVSDYDYFRNEYKYYNVLPDRDIER